MLLWICACLARAKEAHQLSDKTGLNSLDTIGYIPTYIPTIQSCMSPCTTWLLAYTSDAIYQSISLNVRVNVFTNVLGQLFFNSHHAKNRPSTQIWSVVGPFYYYGGPEMIRIIEEYHTQSRIRLRCCMFASLFGSVRTALSRYFTPLRLFYLSISSFSPSGLWRECSSDLAQLAGAVNEPHGPSYRIISKLFLGFLQTNLRRG